ncbi:MAG: hypothetical protein NT062_17485, partial [Proteobacteria bacterium]|nr:hypothetical protein [Pseudomonadota bacterium]
TAGAPTTTTATTTLTYTGDSLIPSEVVDVRDAGTSRSTYTQSDGGRTVDISVDDNDDGVIDTTIHEIYDADRQLLAEDDSAMGVVNFRLRQTYDNRGAELTYGLDFDGAYPLDVSETTVYAGGMRASRAAISPSGMFNDAAYTETWKDTCVAAVPRSASSRGRVDVRTLQDRGHRFRSPAQR